MTPTIKRLEQLEGPDREVDAEIWAELYDHDVRREGDRLLAKSRKRPHAECVVGTFSPKVGFCAEGSMRPPIPYFTGSIDAALTLMPATLKNTILLQTSSPAKAGFGRDGKKFTYFEGATAPIALCIAALKAREVEDAD